MHLFHSSSVPGLSIRSAGDIRAALFGAGAVGAPSRTAMVGGVTTPVTVSPPTPSIVWVSLLPSRESPTLWVAPFGSRTMPGRTVAASLPGAPVLVRATYIVDPAAELTTGTVTVASVVHGWLSVSKVQVPVTFLPTAAKSTRA
ncbi:hypothetical protein WDV06_27105 [Streptomyces racemochromogenes]|uniref:Uncharacterized protein n=1 Tax=Streptomyces racemochromogenes TaxID=67353 RepID=A0ABW7PJY6_9ACTN